MQLGYFVYGCSEFKLSKHVGSEAQFYTPEVWCTIQNVAAVRLTAQKRLAIRVEIQGWLTFCFI